MVKPKPGGPVLLGTSPVVWLVLGGLLVIFGFFLWEGRVDHRGGEPLIRPQMLRNTRLTKGSSRRMALAERRLYLGDRARPALATMPA